MHLQRCPARNPEQGLGKKANYYGPVEYAVETQRNIVDKSRPLETQAKPRVLAIQEGDNDQLDDLVVNAVDRYLSRKNFISGNNRNQGRTPANQSNSGSSNNGNNKKSQKKYTYSSKTGHGQDACDEPFFSQNLTQLWHETKLA